MKLQTLETLARLEQEMAAADRTVEQQALRDAMAALARPDRGYLTTGQAAEQLGVSIPTVKNWIGRGTLIGSELGGRWYVAKESVERILEIRRLSAEMDAEGNPTIEDILRIREKLRSSGKTTQVA